MRGKILDILCGPMDIDIELYKFNLIQIYRILSNICLLCDRTRVVLVLISDIIIMDPCVYNRKITDYEKNHFTMDLARL